MTVVLVDPRRPSLVPVEAVPLLAGEVAYTEELPVAVAWSLPAAQPVHADSGASVLLSSDRSHPDVAARLAAGEQLIRAPDPPAGERLLDAVAVMDRLRTAGPWESEQTHESLRRFLLEETYELFDAVHGGDADELREELGDVLLQVLFHARIAEDSPTGPFGIDDVADALLRKLANRVPAVLAGESISLADQLAQWEQRKALERQEKITDPNEPPSCMVGVPTALPALALAQKVIRRATAAGVPTDLIPDAVTTIAIPVRDDTDDAETRLRGAALDFVEAVRTAERAAVAGRRDGDGGGLGAPPTTPITEQEWRACWPRSSGVEKPPH